MASQKIPQVGAAARSRALNAAYRSKLAVAKRKGLVKSSTIVRGATISKYYRTKLNKLEPVLAGRVSAVKAPPAALKAYRGAGATIVNGRILVEGPPGNTARIKKGEYDEHVIFQNRPLTRELMEEEITFPISTHNVGEMLRYLEDNSSQLQRLKNPADQWGFKINGHRSNTGFGTFAAMVDYMRYYKDIDTIEAVDLRGEPEFLTIFRIVRGSYPGTISRGAVGYKPPKRKRLHTVQDRREGIRDVQPRKAALTDAERQQRRRERLTGDPSHHAKDAERKRKAREKAKGKPLRKYTTK